MPESDEDGPDQGRGAFAGVPEYIMTERRGGDQQGQSGKSKQNNQPALMLSATHGERHEAEWYHQPKQPDVKRFLTEYGRAQRGRDDEQERQAKAVDCADR
jgi:hypothetical protein